jgi:hypothetical protein
MSLYKKSILVIIFVFVSFTLYSIFGKVDQLILNPLLNLDAFLNQSPSLVVYGLIIQQPSSFIFVLLLALITCLLGLEYIIHRKSKFHLYLGINFVFWGIGAFLAGLSYQAFGYYVKCVGFEYCLFTNWIELLYMSFTVLSINALLVAYSYLVESTKWSTVLRKIALSSVLVYSVFQGLGMLIPNQFMLSYEGMLLFLSPNIIIMMIINYRKISDLLHRKLWGLWLIFLGINIAYFVSLFAQQGIYLQTNFNIWFNENDTLHVLLIVWMLLWGWMIPAKKHD